MKYPLLSKTFAVALVVIVLGLVLARIEALVGERKMRQVQATESVQQSLASAQALMGPLLHRSCTEEWTVTSGEGKSRTQSNEKRSIDLMSVPRTLAVDSDMRADARYRGLFKVNGYSGAVTFNAQWDNLSSLQPVREHAGSQIKCGPALLMLSVTDVRGLREVQALVDGESQVVEPGTLHARYPRGVHAELSAERVARVAEPLSARFTVQLVGTARLSLIPAAAQTRWNLRSDWPHPSFGGRFLPNQREIGPNGFAAAWTVTALASTAAAEVQRAGEFCVPSGLQVTEDDEASAPAAANTKCLETLSVNFMDPINPYVLTDRATKYALLFIALTFTCVALVEVLARRRVHPIQYALVGMALAMFYLLLLSLSEHIAFSQAYLVASAACVVLLGYYAAHMLRHRLGGVAFGGGVGVLYAFLWILLSLEQAALVVGSLLLFGALAAVMMLTRRLDWYAVVDGWRTEARA